MNNIFPEAIGYPSKYSMYASKIIDKEDNITYKCSYCEFEVSIDPQDMFLEIAQSLFSLHWKEEHE